MCIYPLMAFYSREVNPKTGKRGITFDRGASFSGAPLRLPCGQCVECRLARSLQWGVRCMHEKQMHDASAFVTLTYDDKSLPEGGSLVPRDHTLFMKRYRERTGSGLRFYMCGEYGEVTKRPHFHYLFFNRDIPDKKYYKMSKDGKSKLYTSELLRDLWPYGHNVVGDVTLESCCYVARYIVDKITGDKADEHYRVVTGDGVIVDRVPEFTRGSRRPGLASEWYNRYGRHSLVSGDFCILNGKRVAVPRYYDGKFELEEPDTLADIKKRRSRKAIKNFRNNLVDRRRVREVVLLRKSKLNAKEI